MAGACESGVQGRRGVRGARAPRRTRAGRLFQIVLLVLFAMLTIVLYFCRMCLFITLLALFQYCDLFVGLVPDASGRPAESETWLRTNGVNTNGAAAKVMNFKRLGKTGTPWHFWINTSRLTGGWEGTVD